MSDIIGNLILDAIIYFIKSVTESAIDWFLTILTDISSLASRVFGLEVVNSAVLYTQALAGAILIVKVAYEAFTTYILRLDGDPDADPGGLLFRTARAAAVIGSVPWIVRWILQFGTVLSSDIVGLPGMNLTEGVQELEEKFITLMSTTYQYVIFIGPIILIAIVIVLLVFLQTFVRAAELAVIAVCGAFMAVGLTDPDSQLFKAWWKELLSVSLSHAVQLFLIKVSFFALATPSLTNNIVILNILMFTSCLWVTYKAPTILKQYMYSSGVTRSAAGATKGVTSMIIRNVISRGV